MTREDAAPFDLLLVEDDPEDALLIQDAFKHCGTRHRITLVRDGEEALEYLQRNGPHSDASTPDLVLLDLNLPRLDGREVLATIRKDPLLNVLPVIILTTSNFKQDIDMAYALHANCYLIKPMDLKQLIALAQAIEQFWMRFVQYPSLAKQTR